MRKFRYPMATETRKRYYQEYHQKNRDRKIAAARQWYEDHREVKAAYDRKRRVDKRDEIRARKNAYYRENHEGILRQKREYASAYPERALARKRVYRAIRDGSLHREPCELCGAAKVEAHHDDYARPLDVRWLCVSCHRRHHAKIRRCSVMVADELEPREQVYGPVGVK